MQPEEILAWCLENLPGTVLVESWGERGIFYNPHGTLKRGVYVATVKEKDGANDKSSRLNRPGVYRLNFGVRRGTFRARFGELPKRPEKGGVVAMPFDFAAPDTLLPHPVYGWMGWLCVLSPSRETFETCRPLLREAWAYAKEKYEKRMA